MSKTTYFSFDDKGQMHKSQKSNLLPPVAVEIKKEGDRIIWAVYYKGNMKYCSSVKMGLKGLPCCAWCSDQILEEHRKVGGLLFHQVCFVRFRKWWGSTTEQ